MGKIAFIFSGQGAQHPGMGKNLYESNENVKALFDKAESIRPGTLEQMFNGSDEELKATENTQPCLYLADIAPALTLRDAGVKPSYVAGFSLGELPALAFAGAFGCEDGFALTAKRGLLMGEATKERKTAMVAVVKLDNASVEEACKEFSEVYPVNYNCKGQLVVAGAAEQIPEFTQRIKARGGMALPLKVAGGFHSPFMDNAAASFAKVIENTEFSPLTIPAYANRTGLPYEEPVKKTLSEQMNHPVLWEKCVLDMVGNGVDTFVETGVGNVLTKLVSKIAPQCKVYTAETAEDCERIAKEILNV